MSEEDGYHLKTVAHALAVLEYLAARGDGVSLRDVSQEFRFSKPTAKRLLDTLLAEGWLRRKDEPARYFLSLKLWQLGRVTVDRLGVIEHAHPWMQETVRVINETILLAMPDGDNVVYVHKADCEQPTQAVSKVGQKAPAYASASGKVMLAYQPRSVLASLEGRLQAFTPYTITDLDRLRRELQEVARRGWARNEQEWRLGVRSAAVPVRNVQGEVVATLSLVGPAERVTPAYLELALPELIRCGRQVSAEMGYTGTL